MPSSSSPEEEGPGPSADPSSRGRADTWPGRDETAPPPVRVSIASPARASELYVVNRAYTLVAQGAGALEAQLPPGRYKVRQRIGHDESVQDLEVPEGHDSLDVKLPALEFSSPIPLADTSLAPSAAEPPLSWGTGNFRFILRAPADPDSPLTGAQAEHLRSEMRRLRLESLDGMVSIMLGDTRHHDEGPGRLEERPNALVFSATLPPGNYVIVQAQHEQWARQTCMPVLILEDRNTAIFCLALHDGDAPVPVQLEHAALAILRDDERALPYQASLLRLEAARKAVGAGNRMHGWSQPPEPGHGQPENILLALLDAQLELRATNRKKTGAHEGESPAPQAHATNLPDLLEHARSVLGPQNADVAALHSVLHPDRNDETMPALDGPPLLRRSWDQLLASPEGNTLAANLMTFPFQPEPSSTWFLWSEAPGARMLALAGLGEAATYAAAISPYPDLGAESWDATPFVGIPPIQPLEVTIHTFGDPPSWEARLGRARARPVTPHNVEATLAALIKSKSFRNRLNDEQWALRTDPRTSGNESLQRLVSHLRALSDPLLFDTLGEDEIARQTLEALRLPRNRIVGLVQALLDETVGHQPASGQRAIGTAPGDASEGLESW